MKTIRKLILVVSVLLASCENESFDPLIEKIDVNSELFNNLRTISETTTENSETICLTFVYPFNIYLYDDEGNISGSEIVQNNVQFVELLGQVAIDNAIGLSYPIVGTSNGNSIEINSNFELKETIEACIENQIIQYCNNILEEPNCVWKIKSQTDDDIYNDALLDFYDDGTAIFYYNGNSYRTSWVSLFIEEELHLNIHLEGTSQTALDWNFNWQASIIDENTIKITNEEASYIIQKNCNIQNNCDYVEFRECEEEIPLVANFIFENYSNCISSFVSSTSDIEYQISYHETYRDAENETNALSTLGYKNSKNPQLIYVRVKTDTIVEIVQIVIVATSCDQDLK
ncbi:hypothetical protein [uncultured Aquimarina sp.]|uniref:hypothetical protein n=1 Tax=uncultured Aquimarina sp. TaxID=575652 RepID=UPI0026059325|nr:hypothetical protein [uncultured Aquimarina sp.]